jgi:hypothetical protein
MKNFYLKLSSIVLAGGLCLTIAFCLSRPANSKAVANDEPSEPSLVAGYKQWTRVNNEPRMVPAPAAVLCAPATAIPTDMDRGNPHRDKFVVVYVNDIGRAAMMEQLKPIFPQGSIVVKEKLATKESTEPELLTVMRKREPGYDSERGDWEYLVFDGPGKKVQASGKLFSCQSCHTLKKETDYIARTYLSSEVTDKLK